MFRERSCSLSRAPLTFSAFIATQIHTAEMFSSIIVPVLDLLDISSCDRFAGTGALSKLRRRSTFHFHLRLLSQVCLEHYGSNQSMKPTAPLRCNFSEVVAAPCGGLSLSR